jgi:hypothetical protein
MADCEPVAGDEVLLYREGCLPLRAIVMAAHGGAITRVKIANPGTWLAFGPDQFEVEDSTPSDWAQHMVLYAVRSQAHGTETR